jgi:hypothetical protein
MNKKVLIGILVGLAVIAVIVIAMIIARNGFQAPATPTSDPGLVLTAANQTAEALVTQIFASTPSATPITPTPTFDAVKTIAAQTALALLTQAAGLTPTPTQTSATTPVPPGPSADRAIFVTDVTIPDGTVIAPVAAFKKTWKLQNAGSSTWTTSYSLAFISGEKMGTVTSVPLTQSVAPGAQIEISVDMVAPTNPGSYQSFWKMKNASGQFFNDSVYVLITVGAGTNPTATAGTPVGTVSPTSTGIPSNPITSLSMSVDNPTFNGQCSPSHTFNFVATLILGQGATLTYKLEASSDTPGFSFTLPGPVTATYGPGTYSLPFALELTSSGTGLVWMHVTAPVDSSSNKVAFDLTCNP